MKKLRDLVPYLDEEITLEADDIRMFVITVLNENEWARSLCIPKENRERLRQMILKVRLLYRVISNFLIVFASNWFLSIYKNRFDAKQPNSPTEFECPSKFSTK